MRDVRDILPIAHFECLQKANWASGDAVLDAYEFCDRVYPIREAARDTRLETLVQANYIHELCVSFVGCLGGGAKPIFKTLQDGRDFSMN